ncbi:MAG: hypothetical protein K9N35_02600 [Candidatus Marinimicrobia bacterium]|nr:hypothetical protein [Candidatus Neomarinimicrobiota bacterium]
MKSCIPVMRNCNCILALLLVLSYQGCDAPDQEISTILSAPGALRAQAIGDSLIRITWVDNSDKERGFFIERDDGQGFIQKYKVAENITEFIDDQVAKDSTYTYRIFAYAILKKSDYSNLATSSLISVTDVDGNQYPAVRIGNQVWMAENLRTKHYRNGVPVTELPVLEQWIHTSAGAYCFYDNSPENRDQYGLLYNWFAVADKRRLAPEGWHIPTEDEWLTLIDHLGGNYEAGEKLKTLEEGEYATMETNSSGFSALPGGYRGGGTYYQLGQSAIFWSSTEDPDAAFVCFLDCAYNGYTREGWYPKNSGASVRCVKD